MVDVSSPYLIYCGNYTRVVMRLWWYIKFFLFLPSHTHDSSFVSLFVFCSQCLFSLLFSSPFHLPHLIYTMICNHCFSLNWAQFLLVLLLPFERNYSFLDRISFNVSLSFHFHFLFFNNSFSDVIYLLPFFFPFALMYNRKFLCFKFLYDNSDFNINLKIYIISISDFKKKDLIDLIRIYFKLSLINLTLYEKDNFS